MTDTQMTLGEIAAKGPNARGVLLRHQLDFCCKGKRTLADACAAAGLDSSILVGELTEALSVVSDHKDWEQAPLPEIVDYIIEYYHRPHVGQLDGVIAAAERVERVHGTKESHPDGLAAHLRAVRADLLDHMSKEEQVLFPAIVSGRRGEKLSGPVSLMMTEHEDHGEALETTRALTANLTPPPEACATWRALYEQLENLEGELMEHIHLENYVLFPRALQGN